jgi:dynactin complex subunit
MTEYFPGHRVQDLDGFKATVRYIGPVAASKNQSEVWLGVEWDDKSRGKHDGSCVDAAGKFHRYFECEMGAGSFVKPIKIKPSYGFYEGLKDRYVEMSAAEIATDNILPDAFVTTASGAQKSIEFVGELKIR